MLALFITYDSEACAKAAEQDGRWAVVTINRFAKSGSIQVESEEEGVLL